MRVLFAGTPQFAVPSLDALAGSAHRIVVVYTQPDRPAGRGRRRSASAVKTRALALDLPVEQPAHLRDPAVVARIADYRVDVIVVVAYGLILPPAVLGLAPLGAVNVHASLLPRWRGAAPVQRAILAGDTETGITIMHMDEGLDTGPVLSQERLAIVPGQTAGELGDRLAKLGGRMLVEALDTAARTGNLVGTPQLAVGATYAHKLTGDDFGLDWRLSAEILERQVRALSPSPGARTGLRGSLLKVLRARVCPASGMQPPGRIEAIDSEGIAVRAGDDTLRLTEVQPAGGKAMSAWAFAQGRALRTGEALGRASDL